MTDERPNALTYGITPSSPASIKPVDIEQWKSTVSPTFRNYYEERYNDLLAQYEGLVRDYERNKLCYEADISFQPTMGKVYHLYRKNTGRNFLSLVSPDSAFWDGYIGSFKLNAQYAWEEV